MRIKPEVVRKARWARRPPPTRAAERASVVEVLEGKAASAFSRTASTGPEEKPKKDPKPRKDGLRFLRV